ncbi:Unknown protein [Striga hermonthica]|uniref:Uncharacterized protein n=1 Tax=Striga hermonthica TaxID=68872 RepID=A0A9N7NG31_STRHE|nr:Unknown protein [Striga hermonthica]
MGVFSPMFALLKPTFSLPLRPLPLARRLPSKAERSPTDIFLHPTALAQERSISQQISLNKQEVAKRHLLFNWSYSEALRSEAATGGGQLFFRDFSNPLFSYERKLP